MKEIYKIKFMVFYAIGLCIGPFCAYQLFNIIVGFLAGLQVGIYQIIGAVAVPLVMCFWCYKNAEINKDLYLGDKEE